MDNNDLKERDFEAYIEHWLLTEGGYTKGDQRSTGSRRKTAFTTCCRIRSMSAV